METLKKCIEQRSYDGKMFVSAVPVCTGGLFYYRLAKPAQLEDKEFCVCPLEKSGNNGYGEVHLFLGQHLNDRLVE